MVAPTPSPIKASVRAAVYLLASQLAKEDGGAVPTDTYATLQLTGSKRSQAYTMVKRLRQVLPSLERPRGRPVSSPSALQTAIAICSAVRDFLMEHPGAVHVESTRHVYSDTFRRFVVGLFAPGRQGAELTVDQAASAIGVPLGTLKDWLRDKGSGPCEHSNGSNSEAAPTEALFSCAQPDIATLLNEYPGWQGDLSSFCEYVRTELHLAFGRTFITHVLTAAGLHKPKARRTPHQAPWSRGSLVTSFPGMQWFGDGKQLRVVLRGNTFTFNLQACLDGASSAAVGLRVTDVEDAQSVVDAFHDGLETVEGVVPMAVTLDSRSCNFAPEVEHALSCTELLHATPGRGQAKAPVEGAFGLFEQSIPDAIVVHGLGDRCMGRSIAELVARAFFCGRNGKPSRKLGGQSPAQAYRDAHPTDEQVEEARRWILVLRQREKIAHHSRKRRADPIRLRILREQLQQLDIADPNGRVSLSLSGYSMDAILRGISTFRAKKEKGTLPLDCDPDRYLGGIIRNTDQRDFLERTAQHLLLLRLRVGDLQLQPLRADAAQLAASRCPEERIMTLVDRALDADDTLAFRFWLIQASDAMSTIPQLQAIPLYRHLTRSVAAAFRTPLHRRERLLATLADAVAPVAA